MTEEVERLVALERDVVHLTERLAGMERKVNEMHAILLQAKGARWILLALAGIGGFLGGKLGLLFPIIGK